MTADVPRPGRPARDQDRPGLEARRGRPAARPQGDRLHRRAAPRPGRARAYISPPPHHDIYSIEDLAQLIADLRAINPARPDRRQARRRRGASARSPPASPRPAPTTSTCPATPAGPARRRCRSIKHVGAPWELGLAEVHQVLLRNGLRDRVALRTDGGLQTGRDLLVAALLGAEEFAFGTAALVALGCDMARQCHLDTCPTGIATQREDLRAKFARHARATVERFVLALAEDVRRELAAIGARSVGEIVGESRRLLAPARAAARAELAPVIGAPSWRRDRPLGGPIPPAAGDGRPARPGLGRSRPASLRRSAARAP